MRSISRSYRKVQGRNPQVGSYLCLASVIKSRKFSRKSLAKAFKELVPKDEFSNAEEKDLIDYLEYLTNLSVEGEKRP